MADESRRRAGYAQDRLRRGEYEQLRAELDEALERLDDIENELLAIKRLPTQMAEMKGSLKTLLAICQQHLPAMAEATLQTEEKVDKLSGWRLGLQFASAVLVPIIVALIGGYFLIKATGLTP